jgi:trehalose 2-sulfotransferase
MGFSAYVLCSTPRSGSTLLCDLLASTDVAGRPHSYYRREDAAYWAQLWDVPEPYRVGDPVFESAYLAAMLRYATNRTGVLGLRLMRSSLADASMRLDCAKGGHANIAAHFAQAFGPTLYVHLSRRDKLAQAISWLRAEQSGLWHRAADGTERERTSPPQAPIYDAKRIAALRNQLEGDDQGWNEFFAARRLHPLRLTYETVSSDRQSALATILLALGRDPGACGKMAIQTSILADAESLDWAERFRRETSSAR